MKYLLQAALILFAAATLTCTRQPIGDQSIQVLEEKTSQEWLVEEEIVAIQEEVDDSIVETETEEDVTDSYREEMISDIVNVWEMFFDDQGANPDDSRRIHFTKYAEELADSILVYQDKDNDTGGWLPKHKTTHLLLATMVTLESSVTYDIVGRSHKERGLLQVHGKALAGYKPKQVQHNSELGLLLGTRWLATLMTECPATMKSLKADEWEAKDWLKPLSVYGGGPRAKKIGKCIHFGVAHKRVNLTKLYQSRIKVSNNV